MLKLIVILAMIFPVAINSWSQVNELSVKDSAISHVIEQIALFPQEKIYIQTDKPVYLSGEKIWFRVFLTDAVLHRPLSDHYVNVVLINQIDTVIKRVIVKCNNDVYSGYIPLDESLTEGNYTLCAYTANMLNTGEDYLFKRIIRVFSPVSVKSVTTPQFNQKGDDYDVTFYPEGGILATGTECRIAFKSLNSGGLPEVISGTVTDSSGNEFAKLVTVHDGMGAFSITPLSGKRYWAVCKNSRGIEKKFELPVALSGVFSMKVECDSNRMDITVHSERDVKDPEQLYLVLHTRGIIHYAATWDIKNESITFDTEKLPSGVLQILLLDGNMNPLCERLVFCRNDDQAQSEIKTDRPNYSSRQEVKTIVKVSDMKGSPLEGSFSVAVTNDNDVSPDSTTNILTTLLLTSELKGTIRDPAFYFREKSARRSEALDLLMLTNGWRRYNIPEALKGNYLKPAIPFTQGMEITGRVRSLVLGKPAENGKVSLFSWEAGFYDEVETSEDGSFAFRGIEFPDSTKFIIQALNKRGNKGVELLVDNYVTPHLSHLPQLSLLAKTPDPKEEARMNDYVSKARTKYTIENGMRMIYLDEIVVTSKATEKEDPGFSFYMPKSASSGINVITREQIDQYGSSNVSDFLKYLPFTQVVEDASGKKKVLIDRMRNRIDRNEPYNYAALIIDDMIITDYDIDMIDPSDIERIGVLKGTQAQILGGEGAGGAIVITTRRVVSNNYKYPVYNIKKIIPPGFQKPVEFYSPKYDNPERANDGNQDLRTTIYWNPDVPVSSSGDASFGFYTADSPGSYTIVIEGLTSDGNIIFNIKRISVK